MTTLEDFIFDDELTERELALVAGGAEPTQNRKFQARTVVKDSHDRYANIEVSYLQ